ncbi:putative Response regulator receiver protein [Candidatus Terasakiella magnetica]|uniref:Putative Response regulator receiver protein n=1 Tax=Candidatus Terasakiella magnetica TaxID=1867952 RepID=A0A1C3RKK0_9PROT|nr:response regulator [Candidatus Terasakiella magnetica]SCA57775.1 putative Response regulator receiver protein [Candidatus Terasakiella magnetica]
MVSSLIKILVVDGDPYAQNLLADQLTDKKHQLSFFETGKKALNELNTHPERYDVVIIDFDLCEEMSDLQCLHAIKDDEKFIHLPVIIKTDNHNITFISDALSAGAFYFLEKSTDKKVVQSLVHSAKKHKEQSEHNDFKHAQARKGIKFAKNASFAIRTLDEMEQLTSLLCCAYPEPESVNLGIHELLTNAIEHGNLGLEYQKKSQLVLDNDWQNEIYRRLNLPENINKFVEVELTITDKEIELVITDQGKGFRSESYMEIDPCRMFDAHGRGIAMALQISFDEVEYIGCGNQVRTVVKL